MGLGGQSLSEADDFLKARARILGLNLRIVQSNHEGDWLDAIANERDWMTGVVVNLGAWAKTATATAEVLKFVGKPVVEVSLGNGKASVLDGIAVKRVSGAGVEAYVDALQHFGGEPKEPKPSADSPKTLGRRPPSPSAPVPLTARSKSLGRKREPRETSQPGVLTRALVREKIADRLAGHMSPSALATWARAHWQEIQSGAPVESGHREVLEEALQTLLLSAGTKSWVTDEHLIDLMATLGT